MKKNKTVPVVMPAKEQPLIIKGSMKVAMGHQSHITGSGVHDPRPRRQRTRNAKRLGWSKEWA